MTTELLPGIEFSRCITKIYVRSLSYELHDVTTLGSAYYPITWTLTQNGGTVTDYTSTGTMYTAIENAFKGTNEEDTLISGKDYKITWKWPISANDGADTILGNIAAKAIVVKEATGSYSSALVEGTDYNTSIAFGITITATQID